jgi:predicted enzyme related to lactoylglutathione lyase
VLVEPMEVMEVQTRDAEAGKAFYPAVFGWAAARPQFEGAPETYVVWEVDGKRSAG